MLDDFTLILENNYLSIYSLNHIFEFVINGLNCKLKKLHIKIKDNKKTMLSQNII